MSSVAIIDYGMGNLHSIAKALQHVAGGVTVKVTSDPSVMRQADRVVFPGVGAIRDCMVALQERELSDVIKELAADRPFLGICLGMQALLEESEENGGISCLGLIPGKVVRFPDGLTSHSGDVLKIPHMGWNRLHQAIEHPLWQGIAQDSWYYFVHSYYVVPVLSAHVAATTNYPDPLAAAISHENLFAVQFHPEKSQEAGLRLLDNFLRWVPI